MNQQSIGINSRHLMATMPKMIGFALKLPTPDTEISCVIVIHFEKSYQTPGTF
jgi:hypothetical protein